MARAMPVPTLQTAEPTERARGTPESSSGRAPRRRWVNWCSYASQPTSFNLFNSYIPSALLRSFTKCDSLGSSYVIFGQPGSWMRLCFLFPAHFLRSFSNPYAFYPTVEL